MTMVWRMVASVALAFVAGCGGHPEEGVDVADRKSPPPPTTVADVVTVSVADVWTAGRVEPAQRVTVASELLEPVVQVYGEVGTWVEAGAPLVELRRETVRAAWDAAVAQRDRAQADWERSQELMARDATHLADHQALESAYRVAESAVNRAEYQLARATVRAPFDGVIARRWVEVGELAAPGAPLVTLESSQALEVALALPQRIADSLEMGAAMRVRRSGDRLEENAAVAERAPSVDGATQTVSVRVALAPGTAFRAGERVEASVNARRRSVMMVPESSVDRRAGLARVHVLTDEGTAEMRWVRLGRAMGDGVEVLAGVVPGERVVVGHHLGGHDGAPLTSVESLP